MKLQLPTLKEHLRTSIWFIPVMLCISALALAMILVWAERQLPASISDYQFFTMPVPAARDVLGVIAGAVLSVGGVVFSMTMVALTLTSGQYGPKVLRQFLSDNGSKISLGMFLGTSLYCLIVQLRYEESDKPGITVIAALILTLISLAGFIRFIHRTATDIQADHVIQRIGGELKNLLCDMTTEEHARNRQFDTLEWRRGARGHRPISLSAHREGYVQMIDYPGIVQWCLERNCYALLNVRAGDFLLQGSSLIKLYALEGDPDSQPLENLLDCIELAPMRNPVQDPEYPITQLNQVAARALSPGINDPGTAITCIDYFSLAIAALCNREIPGKVFLDRHGSSRVLARHTDFAGIMKAFYAPSRQFACNNLPVLISLMDSLIRLGQLTTAQFKLDNIGEHGHELSRTAEGGQHAESDLGDFRQRYKKLCRVTKRFN
ncbi:MAG: DUF2254 domain-containing protein [Halioglobus sp.]|nr:DUF2254 domain-containing protein [Halioglobus sp.]